MNIIQRLFGETEEEQFRYLKPRLMGFVAGIVVALIGALLAMMGMKFGEILMGLSSGIIAVDLLVFGWAILRGLFGIASVGILFSGNVVFGAAIFVLYLVLGYFGGMIVAVIGLCRFLVLCKKKKGN